MIRLVLGGERSGKSAHALALFLAGPAPRILVVTGRARDLDFQARIQAHRLSRPADIPVREAGADLPEVLESTCADFPASGGSVLVDCLDFWLFHCLEQGLSPLAAQERLLLSLGAAQPGDLTLVSCEVGMGPTPAYAAARDFVRHLGGLNQAVAAASQEVCLVVAGCPLSLKRN